MQNYDPGFFYAQEQGAIEIRWKDSHQKLTRAESMENSRAADIEPPLAIYRSA